MSQTVEFIRRLENLKEGERSRLRRLASQPLDKTLQGFDLFTGLWWPLREKSPAAPRREVAWLVAKMFGAIPVPNLRPDEGRGPSLAGILGRREPSHPACRGAALLTGSEPKREPARSQFLAARRYRRRFDAVLSASLGGLEPHLRWALSVIADDLEQRKVSGVDWVLILEDLSLWDGEYNPDNTRHKGRLNDHEQVIRCHETHRTPQDLWACEYLSSVNR